MEELRKRDCAKREVSRLLGVSEGTVRSHEKRWTSSASDGRCRERSAASGHASAIAHWRSQQEGVGANLALLHDWLVREHGHDGSLRSVQRYWKRKYPAPKIRARRRVETPPGAQVQVDWAHFPRVFLGREVVDLVALHMVLSWSRKEAAVWALDRKMLSWLHCHTACFVRSTVEAPTPRTDAISASVRPPSSRSSFASSRMCACFRRCVAALPLTIPDVVSLNVSAVGGPFVPGFSGDGF